MEQVIYFWNRLYYGMFECNRRTDVFLYKYIHSLTRSLYNLLHKKKMDKRRDKSIFNDAISALSNPRLSSASTITDILISTFTALLTWTSINFMSILIPDVSLVGVDKITFVIVSVIPGLTINYFLYGEKTSILYILRYFKRVQKNEIQYGVL